MIRLTWIVAFAALISVSGCTKKESSGGAGGPQTKVTISTVGESMLYDKKTLIVKAGEEITLTMKNPSKTLAHNWVLVEKGKENDIGIGGIKAGESKDFIPDLPGIIAHTKMLKPGEEQTITFKAPPVGQYPYICTNAGHHTVMKGTLISK